MPESTKAKALRRLMTIQNEIPGLKQMKLGSPEFKKWHRNAEIAISYTFSRKPEYLEHFKGICYSLLVASSSTPESYFQEAYIEGLLSANAVLQSMIEEIEEYWEEDRPTSSIPETRQDIRSGHTKEVFVVHGRDDAAKQTVARFLEKLNLGPIILHEQPNQGRTLIEKFECHARAGFAVVLLTADDVGALRGNEDSLAPDRMSSSSSAISSDASVESESASWLTIT